MNFQHFRRAQSSALYLYITLIGPHKQTSIRYFHRMLVCSLLDQLFLKNFPAMQPHFSAFIVASSAAGSRAALLFSRFSPFSAAAIDALEEAGSFSGMNGGQYQVWQKALTNQV